VDRVLSLLGLAKKAGLLEAGEEPVGTAARARDVRLILLAEDAAENTVRRAGHFAQAGQCLCASVPATKEELGRAVGRASCAMLALTDVGFASAVAEKLAQLDPARYGSLSERLSVKAARAAERKRARQEQRVRTGKTAVRRKKRRDA